VIVGVAGKGGVGKTTIAALLIRSLLERGLKPLLAVDADPNSCLHEKIGVEAGRSLGQIREESVRLKREAPAGLAKRDVLEMEVQSAIIEGTGFDVLAMGRQEGPGCYCYVNNLLRSFVDGLGGAYKAIVIDNEAGMEHLSRRTNAGVDVMLFVCEPTRSSARAVARLKELAQSLDFRIGAEYVVVNRANGALEAAVQAEIEGVGLETIGFVPEDEAVLRYESQDESLLKLPADSAAAAAVDQIVNKLIEGGRS
jgi:CO dehydrogenase maturation factor